MLIQKVMVLCPSYPSICSPCTPPSHVCPSRSLMFGSVFGSAVSPPVDCELYESGGQVCLLTIVSSVYSIMPGPWTKLNK